MNNKLKREERLISVSYSTFQALLDRCDYIREQLQDSISNSDQYISQEYISQDEDKYYLNFVLTPNYID